MYGVLSIDSTPESEAEINDILCRTRELCEVGGVSLFSPFTFSEAVRIINTD